MISRKTADVVRLKHMKHTQQWWIMKKDRGSNETLDGVATYKALERGGRDRMGQRLSAVSLRLPTSPGPPSLHQKSSE